MFVHADYVAARASPRSKQADFVNLVCIRRNHIPPYHQESSRFCPPSDLCCWRPRKLRNRILSIFRIHGPASRLRRPLSRTRQKIRASSRKLCWQTTLLQNNACSVDVLPVVSPFWGRSRKEKQVVSRATSG